MNEALAVLAFHQVYDPVGGNIALSALIAGVPLYILFIMLAVLRLPAWISALVAMLSAAILAALVWQMPLGLDISATTEGMANGLWPISWIVLNAVFFHNLTIASGDFDVIRRSLTRLTGDRRVQGLLVAFWFRALLARRPGLDGRRRPAASRLEAEDALGLRRRPRGCARRNPEVAKCRRRRCPGRRSSRTDRARLHDVRDPGGGHPDRPDG